MSEDRELHEFASAPDEGDMPVDESKFDLLPPSDAGEHDSDGGDNPDPNAGKQAPWKVSFNAHVANVPGLLKIWKESNFPVAKLESVLDAYFRHVMGINDQEIKNVKDLREFVSKKLKDEKELEARLEKEKKMMEAEIQVRKVKLYFWWASFFFFCAGSVIALLAGKLEPLLLLFKQLLGAIL
ncbi:MAG: hypothetical protein HY602_02695 [Parcubacteria group bacterium]|nr:hypothetical protein [Parcubacteria group bacterium]